ncbi:hypothetical protein EBT23_00170 [bacterium]|nr:hypothetical protein [bacterium]
MILAGARNWLRARRKFWILRLPGFPSGERQGRSPPSNHRRRNPSAWQSGWTPSANGCHPHAQIMSSAEEDPQPCQLVRLLFTLVFIFNLLLCLLPP